MGDFLDFPTLQDPQEFGLHGKRQFSDFIQKNGARVRHFKFSGKPSGFGSGEGPCVIPEQLRLHKLLGKRRAVHGHERFVRPGAGHVQGLGHQLLACP